jgi:hypothetical protein
MNMDSNQRARILEQLAAAIARRRLTAPARLALDVIAPVAFLASQVALVARPLTPLGGWHDYVAALEDEQGWKVLQQLVDNQDC